MSTENLKEETLINDSSLKINLEKNIPKKESRLKKYKFFYSSWGAFFSIILILGIIAIIITGTSPCLHTKCHPLATCVNTPFYADCVCNYGYAGNGRDHCDGKLNQLFFFINLKLFKIKNVVLHIIRIMRTKMVSEQFHSVGQQLQ